MGRDICSDERREDEGVIGRGPIIYVGDRAESLARKSEGKAEGG